MQFEFENIFNFRHFQRQNTEATITFNILIEMNVQKVNQATAFIYKMHKHCKIRRDFLFILILNLYGGSFI